MDPIKLCLFGKYADTNKNRYPPRYLMGKLIISLSDEKEKELRKLAMEKYGGKKGALSKIVEEGITLVKDNFDQAEADIKFEETVKNAKKLGVIKFNRQEANYRKIFP